MSERVGIDRRHGITEIIPADTWSNIEPDRVIALALRHIPGHDRIHAGMGLRSLISLVEPTLSDELQARLRNAPIQK